MKVVVTSTLIPLADADLAAFEGMDVEVEIVDGTDRDILLQGKSIEVVLSGDTLGAASQSSYSDDNRRGGG